MLAQFQARREKNHLGGKIFYRSLGPPKNGGFKQSGVKNLTKLTEIRQK